MCWRELVRVVCCFHFLAHFLRSSLFTCFIRGESLTVTECTRASMYFDYAIILHMLLSNKMFCTCVSAVIVVFLNSQVREKSILMILFATFIPSFHRKVVQVIFLRKIFPRVEQFLKSNVHDRLCPY